MKIFIIVDDYMPNSIRVGAKMMHELSCELYEQGHKVTVITPETTLKTKYSIDYLNNIRICRFKSGKIKNVNKIKRVISETLFSFRAWQAFKKEFKKTKYDLIIYYSPTIFWGSLVSRLKKYWDAPAYLILRDFFPQWAIDQGLIKQKSIIEKYFRYFEAKNYDVADRIGVMSPKNLEWFKNNTQVSKPVEILYNWVSENPIPKTVDYKLKLGLQDKIVYFYGGNMGHAQDMMNLVKLAKNMKSEIKVHFVFVGAGDEVELIEESIEKYSLNNITLLPAVSQEEFKQMLVSFDVGLFTLNKNHKTHNFPGKLLGYMVQEMPILGSVNPKNDLKNILEEFNAGLVTVNGEDELLYKNAKKLLDGNLRCMMGKNAKRLLIDKFSAKQAAKKIIGEVK